MSHTHSHAHLEHTTNFRQLTIFIIVSFIVIISLGWIINKKYTPLYKQEEATGIIYSVGEITNIEQKEVTDEAGESYIIVLTTLEFQDGPQKGKSVTISQMQVDLEEDPNTYRIGNTVVVNTLTSEFGEEVYIADNYRINGVIILFAVFFGLIIFFTGKKGVSAIFGLIFTMIVIFAIIIPLILAGFSPLLVTISGASVIAFISVYMAHGITPQTSIAVAAIIITLLITTLISVIITAITTLYGTGSDEALSLLSYAPGLNLKGLLLSGIILGTVGVLDDVTTAQAATVNELKKANVNLTRTELYESSINVGHEHILSLVNTLVLAYVGAAFPLFVLFMLSNTAPIWVSINNQFLLEEIVRSVIGSIGVILAVPIASLLATWYYSKKQPQI